MPLCQLEQLARWVKAHEHEARRMFLVFGEEAAEVDIQRFLQDMTLDLAGEYLGAILTAAVAPGDDDEEEEV